MAFLHIPNVRMAGISACVPRHILENTQYKFFTQGEAEKFIESTGVERHRVANDDTCTSDLCLAAAEKLIFDLKWNKSQIDSLVFVTQTPDYIIPATSCILQHRLGLSEETVAIDISLGCSGWIYGLYVLSNMISSGQLRKGLLLVGDTTLKPCSFEDKSTYPLFGDAGTATAVEYDKDADGFKFHLAVDGSGYSAIIIPDGGYRNRVNLSSLDIKEFEPGIKRNKLQTVLDGMNVFSFGITKAPESVKKLADKYEINLEDVNYFLFHQANKYLNEKIRKKLNIPIEKVPYSLKNFGNTSSATIPLTMVSEIAKDLTTKKLDLIACGFGVGLSWGTVHFTTEKLVIPEIIEY